MNIDVCLRCVKARCSGSCVCSIDGVAVETHATRGECPHPAGSKFDKPEAPRPAAKAVTQAVPQGQWPLAVKAVAAQRRPGEIGVGDTLKRLIDVTSLNFANLFAAAYKKLVGRECGCGDRQAKLNQMYPYGDPS